MIKWAVVFSLAFVALVKGAVLPDNILKSIRASLKDCYQDDAKKIKVEFSEAAFESLITNNPYAQRATKCMRYCAMVSLKMYNSDGSKNVPEIVEFLKKAFPGVIAGYQENIITETVHKCLDTDIIKDRCELAHASAVCFIAKLLQQGIELIYV